MKRILIILFVCLFIVGGAKGQNCPSDDSELCSQTYDATKPIVYPIPANDMLNFRFIDSMQGTIYIKLYDLMGRIIDNKSYAKSPSLVTFDIGYLPHGIYSHEIKNNWV